MFVRAQVLSNPFNYPGHHRRRWAWTLQAEDGRTWSLSLLVQADPAYSGGLRLRHTERSGMQRLDHRRPLQWPDGLGGAWELANRSDELVPIGVDDPPPGSAPFDLAGLQPGPRPDISLALAVPLHSVGEALLEGGPTAVQALHGTASPVLNGDR
jgi:hypothetical protein